MANRLQWLPVFSLILAANLLAAPVETHTVGESKAETPEIQKQERPQAPQPDEFDKVKGWEYKNCVFLNGGHTPTKEIPFDSYSYKVLPKDGKPDARSFQVQGYRVSNFPDGKSQSTKMRDKTQFDAESFRLNGDIKVWETKQKTKRWVFEPQEGKNPKRVSKEMEQTASYLELPGGRKVVILVSPPNSDNFYQPLLDDKTPHTFYGVEIFDNQGNLALLRAEVNEKDPKSRVFRVDHLCKADKNADGFGMVADELIRRADEPVLFTQLPTPPVVETTEKYAPIEVSRLGEVGPTEAYATELEAHVQKLMAQIKAVRDASFPKDPIFQLRQEIFRHINHVTEAKN